MSQQQIVDINVEVARNKI